jgi:predicted SnoaL-like aldol condensation-catalyzing enzyme
MTNKEIAVGFWNTIYTEHDALKASTFISDNYIQHNPNVPDKKEGFLRTFTALFADPINAGIYTEIKSVIFMLLIHNNYLKNKLFLGQTFDYRLAVTTSTQ